MAYHGPAPEQLVLDLRALVEGGSTISGAARALNISKGSAIGLCQRRGIKPDPEAVKAGLRRGAEIGRAAIGALPPRPHTLNPKLSAAQNAVVAQMKRAIWTGARRLPAPTAAEADAAVAAFLARGGQVTRCETVHVLPAHDGLTVRGKSRMGAGGRCR